MALAILDEFYEEVTERHESTTPGNWTQVEESMGMNNGLSRTPSRITNAMVDAHPLADQMMTTLAEFE